MKKILYMFQIALKLFLVFSIAFIWLRFFIKSIALAFAISLAITLIFEVLHTSIKKKNFSSQSLKLKEKEEADNMFLSLITDVNYLDFFEEMFKSRYKNIFKNNTYLIIKKEEENVVFVPYFKMQSLTCNDLIEILKQTSTIKEDKVLVACYDYDKEVSAFLKNFNEEITLLNRFELYSLFKEYEYFPEITKEIKKEKKSSLKDLLSMAFNKSKTKGYLISAFILFLTSFFVRINVYYCVICSLLLLFALISYINPKYNKKNIKEVI